jgi:hypothetical protein
MQWYVDQIMRLIPSSPEVFKRFQLVNHMMAGPETLFHPAVLGRVLRRALTPDWSRWFPTLARRRPAVERKAATGVFQTQTRTR